MTPLILDQTLSFSPPGNLVWIMNSTNQWLKDWMSYPMHFRFCDHQHGRSPIKLSLLPDGKVQFFSEGRQSGKTGKWELTNAYTLHLMFYDHTNLKRAGAFSLLEFSDCMMSTLQTVDPITSKHTSPAILTPWVDQPAHLDWYCQTMSASVLQSELGRKADVTAFDRFVTSDWMCPIGFCPSPIPNKIRLPRWHIDYRPFQTHFFL